ncbi:hypothetical protein [Aurantiacibacter sp. D1-12]|uniref:hypothetical protein n=1 Tax=Aurantiacibacter sp. D1-12 TaxID=2993658 RepID=UPI00237D0B80|nr:hypothetical protein [Aurantiacibacter sp. D1-12]MDE1467582.1 hypothetical protein [Aurantiacibacter sp. D1-12]
MLKRFAILFAALFLAPAQVAAQDEQAEDIAYDLEGFWAFQIDDAVIFLFELDQMPDGNWRARWTRPERFGSNGVIFNNMAGATRIVATEAIETEEGVQLSFPDPRPEAVPNVFLFELVSDHQVTMTYVDTPLEPFPLIRVWPTTRLGPFDNDRLYDRDNAVTETDYVEPEPIQEEVVEEEVVPTVEDAAEEAAPEDVEATSGLSGDFLDGFERGLEVPDQVDMDEASGDVDEDMLTAVDEAEPVRACVDLDDIETVEGLDAVWGADFTQIGSGLDIREYEMDNGDVARVTMLGERVYVNSCGPAE